MNCLTGHGNKLQDVTNACLWTCGSLLEASRQALIDGITCSPSSGFHHAHYDSNGGFCTFNGLIVAAQKLFTEQLAGKVGIIDADMHYGDGSQDCIDTLDLHDQLKHWTFGAKYGRDTFSQAELLDDLKTTLNAMKSDAVELILYQAGADPHINDPLGGVMTTEEMLYRDRFVFETCQALGLACCYCHAGGYQRDAQGGITGVLELHRNTAKEAIRVLSDSALRQNLLPSTTTAATTTKKRIRIRDTTLEDLGTNIAIIGGIRSPRTDGDDNAE